MSIESQIRQSVSKEIGNRDITIVAQRHSEFVWPRGIKAKSYANLGYIIVNNKFAEIDRDACNFLVKHEIGHIDNHSWERNSATIFKTLNYVLPIIVGGIAYRSIPSLSVGFIGTAITSIFSYCIHDMVEGVLSRRHEYWADSYAIKTSTSAELKGGLRFFEACMQTYHEDTSWTFSHPTHISRFTRIKNELESRGEVADLAASEDQQKINDMHCWEVLDRSEKLKIPTDKEALFEDFKKRHILGNDS